MTKYILTLDAGTTSTRAILYDLKAKIRSIGQHEFTQYFPYPGWVEHNPEEIWNAQQAAIRDALSKAHIDSSNISCIGITNQRETTVIWDKKTGKPVTNAIVWQCRRTSGFIDEIRKEYGSWIKAKTGLMPDSYFSAPKIRWILDNIPGTREKAEKGNLRFGTIDTYLIHRLTKGHAHITDPSNASRTLLYNIKKGAWDQELLEIFHIPENILPEVKPSSGLLTQTDLYDSTIPLTGCAGDQQAALFGHQAINTGDTKCTYGT